MRRVRWAAASYEGDGVEVAEQKKRGQQGEQEIEVGEQRKSYMREPAQSSSSVDFGRVIDLLRDRHPASEQNYGPERQPSPNMRADRRTQREPTRIEPGR